MANFKFAPVADRFLDKKSSDFLERFFGEELLPENSFEALSGQKFVRFLVIK